MHQFHKERQDLFLGAIVILYIRYLYVWKVEKRRNRFRVRFLEITGKHITRQNEYPVNEHP